MGRTICVWLIACLALAYASPVPGPASEADLLNLILNAKPEDNDIDLQAANLISDSNVKDHESTNIDIPESEDPIYHDKEEQELPESEGSQGLQPVQEEEQVQDPSEQDEKEHGLEIQIESESISVPEEDQVQTKQETDEILVPEEDQVQTKQETDEISVPEEDQVQTKEETDEISVPEEDQVPTKQETDEISVPEEEIIEIELEEVIPISEEQPVPVELGEQFQVDDELMIPLEPEEEQIISVPEDSILQIFEAEEPSPVNEEEESFPLIEEEIIIPVYEEEIPIESYEAQIIPIHRDDIEIQPEIVDTMTNFGNEEQLPIIHETEDVPEIVIGLEETAFNQPISDEPMIPGFIKEEIQPHVARPPVEIPNSAFDSSIPPYFVVEESQEDMPSMHEEQLPIVDETEDDPEVVVVGLEEAVFNHPISDDARPSVEIQNSAFDSFIPPYFVVEEPQENMPPMHDESQGPVYFDAFADPESSREDSFESMEDHREEPMGMPVEEKVPFVIIDVSGPQQPNHWFDVPNFPVTPTAHPYGDDTLEDYYIPGSNFPVEDPRYENPDASFHADEDAHHETDDSFPVYQSPEEEHTHFPDDPVLEVFPPMEVISEDMIPDHSSEQFDDEIPTEEVFISEPTNDQVPVEETFIPELLHPEVEHNPTLEVITDVFDSEPMMKNDSPFIITNDRPRPEGMEETIFMINPQGIREDANESTLEIISQNPGDSHPFGLPMITDIMETKPMISKVPESVIKAVQHIFANEQIVPIKDFIPKEKLTPIIIEQESYWIPENPDQQAIIFPNEYPLKHNLPVFPHQWNEEHFFHPPTNDHVHSHDLNIHMEPPSYGPVPQHPPMMEEPQSAFDIPLNDDLSPKMPDFRPSSDFSPKIPAFRPPSDVSDMPRKDMLPFPDSHNVNMNSPSGHLHSPDEFHENSRIPFYPKRFNLPSAFELPSLPDIAFHQDFHGPNTFPLNFRRPEFTPNLNREKIYPKSPVTPNHFQQRLSNLPSFPNSMPNTPNRPIVFPMPDEPRKMLENPHEPNMNMNLHLFRSPSMPMHPERFQKQQYDVQVMSFVPYKNSYNFHPYGQHSHDDFNYPYANNFDTFQDSSYNVPPYGGLNTHPNQGLYSSPPFPDRYGSNYNYRPQSNDYHPYNYPTPTW